MCRNARKVQPQAARQLTLVFGPDTISQAAWRWAMAWLGLAIPRLCALPMSCLLLLHHVHV